MSLTSHLKDPASPVHRLVRENFPDARAIVRAANAGLEGAAPDHREGEPTLREERERERERAGRERGRAERLEEELRELRERRSRSRWRRIICR